MPRKSKATSRPDFYTNMHSTNLHATPTEVAEEGTVRMALLLDTLEAALKDFPGAALAVSGAILEKLGANPNTRIMP